MKFKLKLNRIQEKYTFICMLQDNEGKPDVFEKRYRVDSWARASKQINSCWNAVECASFVKKIALMRNNFCFWHIFLHFSINEKNLAHPIFNHQP